MGRLFLGPHDWPARGPSAGDVGCRWSSAHLASLGGSGATAPAHHCCWEERRGAFGGVDWLVRSLQLGQDGQICDSFGGPVQSVHQPSSPPSSPPAPASQGADGCHHHRMGIAAVYSTEHATRSGSQGYMLVRAKVAAGEPPIHAYFCA